MEPIDMNNELFQETVRRLEEVNAIVEKLDPNIRGSAFELFRPYLAETLPRPQGPQLSVVTTGTPGPSSLLDLMEKHPGAAAHENAYLLAAFWYGQYGIEPFSLDDVRKLASGAGLTVPERLDMTYKQAKADGKMIFQVVGRASYKPTVGGEGWLKMTFGVSKGRPRPEPEAKP
jgi:hypothetical protein